MVILCTLYIISFRQHLFLLLAGVINFIAVNLAPYFYILRYINNILKFNLETLLRMIILNTGDTELDASEFLFLNFKYTSYHLNISTNLLRFGVEFHFSEFAMSKVSNFKFQ